MFLTQRWQVGIPFAGRVHRGGGQLRRIGEHLLQGAVRQLVGVQGHLHRCRDADNHVPEHPGLEQQFQNPGVSPSPPSPSALHAQSFTCGQL